MATPGASSSEQEVSSHSVCSVCQGFGDLKNSRGAIVQSLEHLELTPPADVYHYYYIHHPNLATLLQSAKAGCRMCTMLFDGLRNRNGILSAEVAAQFSLALGTAGTQSTLAAHVAGSDDKVSIDTDLAEVKEHGGMERPERVDIGRVVIQVTCKDKTGPRGSKGQRSLEVYTFAPPGQSFWNVFGYFNTSADPFDPRLQHRPSQDLLSEPHIALINHWRQTCEKYHKSCCKITSKQQLPSRILELLDPGDENNGVRLVETQPEMHGTYACLSYCWGNSKTQTGQTTRANLLSQVQGIPYRTLPNTVIDAIQLSYKLGFRYLWVDRLCIVQDDEKDWSTEASKMCDVYSRSALTISVPICSDSSQSFLTERRKRFREQKQLLAMEYMDEGSGLRHSLWLTPHLLFKSGGPWFLEGDWTYFSDRKKNEANHWLDRGWTFQEWVLSPRVLHIDTVTLWDCLEGYANELNRRHMDTPILLRDPKHPGQRSRWGAMYWNRIVEEYAKREVHFEKDKLLALAGLAALYGQDTGYKYYLCGLWLEEMPRSLLWSLDHERPLPNNHRLANQDLPSWSWASWNIPLGPSRIDKKNLSSMASIDWFHYCEKCSNSFRAVKGAWIDIDGCLRVVTAEQPPEDQRTFIQAANESWLSFTDDKNGYPKDLIANDGVYLLLLGFVYLGEDDPKHYHALVLQSCGIEDGRRYFRRLGRALKYGKSNSPVLGLEPLWKQELVRIC